MRRCLRLAERARGRTSPNPLVGCVIVGHDGRVLAEGFHRRAGAPHAEIDALDRSGDRARGATLYVNLEPCAHVGRTGPCAPAVVAAGVRRVVVGTADPFPLVDGRGLRILREAGIDVTVGLLADECRALNEPFFTSVRTGRPYVTLKAAISLDGRLATATGDARWVTGAESRRRVHELRDESDAILVGIDTVLADDPLLTTRLPPRHRPRPWTPRDPVRVILDGRLRTPPTARLLATGSAAPTLIFGCAPLPGRRARALEQAGAEVVALPGVRRSGPSPRVDLRAALRLLAKRDLRNVLVEGGGAIHASFIDRGLWDRLLLFIAPRLVGADGVPLLRRPAPARMADALRVGFASMRRVGDDILVDVRPLEGDPG